ncbi:hypothetical protein GCM10022206_31170 [Streptomyces chiangmaiensis]
MAAVARPFDCLRAGALRLLDLGDDLVRHTSLSTADVQVQRGHARYVSVLAHTQEFHGRLDLNEVGTQISEDPVRVGGPMATLEW